MAIHSYVLKTMNSYEIHLCVHNSQSFAVDLSKSWISKQLCLIDYYPGHLIQVACFPPHGDFDIRMNQMCALKMEAVYFSETSGQRYKDITLNGVRTQKIII
jgi:hypothetical protein